MDKFARRRVATAAATVCTVFMGALVAPGAEATPSQAPAGKGRLPDLITGHDRPSHGRVAVEMLGDRLPEAARRNGMAAERLREILVEDPTAWLDGDARLYYEDPARTEGTDVIAHRRGSGARPAGPDLPPAQQARFAAHDLPRLQRAGRERHGLEQPARTGPRLPPGLDPRRRPTTFNTAEREAVQSVWQRVAEDFAPFDVDVTTQDPGAASLTRADAADQIFGTRALISPSTNAASKLCRRRLRWDGLHRGLRQRRAPRHYQPAWVFPQSLGNDARTSPKPSATRSGTTSD